jgi:hypothetical protein
LLRQENFSNLIQDIYFEHAIEEVVMADPIINEVQLIPMGAYDVIKDKDDVAVFHRFVLKIDRDDLPKDAQGHAELIAKIKAAFAECAKHTLYRGYEKPIRFSDDLQNQDLSSWPKFYVPVLDPQHLRADGEKAFNECIKPALVKQGLISPALKLS